MSPSSYHLSELQLLCFAQQRNLRDTTLGAACPWLVVRECLLFVG